MKKQPSLGAESEREFHHILAEQILHYSKMEIQDLYKLIHQGALGSEHAVADFKAARSWLEKEMAGLLEGPEELIVDPISTQGKIARVNLRPYLLSGGDPSTLLDAFVKTANEFRGAPDQIPTVSMFCRRNGARRGAPLSVG